jgi:RNase P protein component
MKIILKSNKQPSKRSFNAVFYGKHRSFSENFFWWLIRANSNTPMDAVMVPVGVFLFKV